MVEQIVELAHPLRVVLFGSAATGKATSDSDLDFLVVVPEDRETEQVVDLLNTGIRPRPMPCDFIVVTPLRPPEARQDHRAHLPRNPRAWQGSLCRVTQSRPRG
ncbi:MAG: hypothetical protein A3K19_05780 [Lentisphaerae bacterium RIFOXYB12_FULL_65_16]|nr:MAG: hypothetical protein A3K18_15395 [Lentisphaerae bacterium RIFOXYA12_64_32]OGV95082.1 MAG: hypothetical protein A3K19_05780 [Lentisphaerae bacterium RIFOXYB12_FULL_65_16]